MNTALCIVIGIAVGIIAGIALHSYVWGLVIGIAAGLLLCLVPRIGRRR